MAEGLNTFLMLCGAIAIIGSAGAVVYKIIIPVTKIVGRVKTLEVKAENDYKAINAQTEADRVICTTLLALLDHAISGNDVEKLKSQRAALNKYLISK